MFIINQAIELSALSKRLFIFLSSFLTVLIFALLLKSLINSFLLLVGFWAEFVIIIFAILIFPLIKSFYSWMAKVFIFPYSRDSLNVIAGLNKSLKNTLNVDEIYIKLSDLLCDAFRAKSFVVFSYNESDNNFSIVFNNGFDVNFSYKKNISCTLNKNCFADSKAMAIESLINCCENSDELAGFLIKLKAGALMPVNIKNKFAGFFILGRKETGGTYNKKDLQTLGIAGAQASMAIENALMYQETKNFNNKLEEEVARATKELREANNELMKLDKAKSDFISIASHQLRTPLTVIKGYISMMMEGNFGELPESIAGSIKKVYDSNERLILLVENLLNISRIESGNLQFNLKETDIEELAISVIDELQDTAKKNGNELVYKPSVAKIPCIIADSGKIRHVILNYLDNAIKYSEKGKIIIRLIHKNNKIIFSVRDSGIGLSSEEITNLFRKFYRGSLTPLIHTEGTGLGLYVAKQMIKLHKGRVWAESKGKNKGATFYFSLPLPKAL
ncbi:hypothetical protein KAJ61_00515 [Candidatus Parcubacteria bacterium]|nr:hypothetical protein [Candidatus Parcubacteria bacterium]